MTKEEKALYLWGSVAVVGGEPGKKQLNYILIIIN